MIKAHFLVPLVSVLAFAAPARALDCAKATTPDEKAICGNADLKARDAALSRFYFDTLRGLKGARHALLIADQRRWLQDDRSGACEPSATMTARAACLSTSLAARRRAIAICFADSKDATELGGKPVGPSDTCTVVLHPTCPKVTVTISAGLTAYPWLFQKLLDDAKTDDGGSDCGPETADSPGQADQNESSSLAKILTERPDLVSVRFEDDSMSRGAAHPQHGERITSYDTRTKAEIPIAAILPNLKTDAKLLAAINAAADKALDVPCCGDEGHQTLQDIGLEAPMPDAWAVSPSGDLIVGYDYNAMARDFVATATIPRALFISAVPPKYAGFFVKDSKAP